MAAEKWVFRVKIDAYGMFRITLSRSVNYVLECVRQCRTPPTTLKIEDAIERWLVFNKTIRLETQHKLNFNEALLTKLLHAVNVP